jgi:threonine synthase
MRRPLIERWRDRLPSVTKKTPIISLMEGSTPLIKAVCLPGLLGLDAEIYFKFEGLNPTGSFKDRGMTLAMSKAVEEGAKGVLCASTGNTAASAAAYAARAGLPCRVFLPSNAVAAGKLAQSIMHGAEIMAVNGNFDDALEKALELAKAKKWTVVNSLNPYRLEGQKTAAFEVLEDLGAAPDYQFMPVGNAGNITAYWRGYKEMGAEPMMMGFQAAGAAPLVLGKTVKEPKTIATAIRIGNPVSKVGALAARDESGGVIESVTDAQILDAYRTLAREEGVFCEPSSATGVAGLIKLARTNKKLRGKIVCVLTGHGLKDPETPKTFKFKRTVVK